VLKIRKKQIETFDKIAEDRFVDKLIAYLKDKQSVWVANSPDAELRQRVQWGINRARSHGLTWESSIMKFVSLMFRIAPNFDEYPPIAALLARTDIPANDLADRLFSDITTEQWEAATQRYDPAAWEFEE
jgi:hypothetical protein